MQRTGVGQKRVPQLTREDKGSGTIDLMSRADQIHRKEQKIEEINRDMRGINSKPSNSLTGVPS